MISDNCVYLRDCSVYDSSEILKSLPDEIFDCIEPGEKIVLKPNWVRESHKERPEEWEYVITHPEIITAVIQKVLPLLNGDGRITVLDGPVTDANFKKLIDRYPVDEWRKFTEKAGVSFEIVDLRDHEWVTQHDVTVKRIDLKGDPRGKVVVDLKERCSEFYGHARSSRGYYGADYDRKETNQAHDGYHNLYSVSKTCLEADVFINLPKLKTHRKAGITCCLKNLVGINTYKNYLPHHNEGSPSEGGDQFPGNSLNSRLEGPLVSFIKQYLFKNPRLASFLSPLNDLGKAVFGQSNKVIRNGSWYGNDTLWRMVLDLNKVLMYADSLGSMQYCKKKYIGIVDAILAGEGEGPMCPDPIEMGYVISGKNPVAIDAVCAYLMGFDPQKIPSIKKAFHIESFPLCSFDMDKIRVFYYGEVYDFSSLPSKFTKSFVPQFGWAGYLQRSGNNES